MDDAKKRLIYDLERIQKNGYQLNEGEKAWDYIELMLEYMGDPDSRLRDDLIYSTFCEWICEKEYFSNTELLTILNTLMDEEHLFYKIGSTNNNTVFMRTFSILGVVLVLFQHRKKPFIDSELFMETKSNILRYYKEEMDFRGYTEEAGWAHGAAHGADALDELIQCSESDADTCKEVLDSIQRVLYNEKYLLCNEEDERITRVVSRMIRRGLISEQNICHWIDGLVQCLEGEMNRKQYVARVNTKNFARCLYFRLMHHYCEGEITNHLYKLEEKLNRFLKIDKEK